MTLPLTRNKTAYNHAMDIITTMSTIIIQPAGIYLQPICINDYVGHG